MGGSGMAMRAMTAWLLGVLHTGIALAQAPEEMPPLSLAPPPKAPSGSVMPGVVVSQALQSPVEPPPAPLPIPVPPPPVLTEPVTRVVDVPNTAIQWWARAEYLIWWPKQQPLIPLVTGNNDGFIPVIGSPGTAVLIGNSSVSTLNVPGGKYTMGAELGGPNRLGIEANYFSLGTQNSYYSSGGFGPDAYRFLAVPYIDPTTNQESAFNIRLFGPGGELQAFTSTRVTGWESLLSMNLYEMPGFRIQGLAGYRYFLANEGLLIKTISNDTVFNQDEQQVSRQTIRTDEVLTSNRFQGGTIGTRTNIDLGPAFFELDSKVSFGCVRQVVQRNGASIETTEGDPNPVSSANGLFVQSTNAGKFVNTQYAVMPEAGMKLGFTYRAAKLFFGYNVIYLNQAVRPSDQLDRTVDLNNLAFGFPSTSSRPSPAIVMSDFWVQGVSFGFELRY